VPRRRSGGRRSADALHRLRGIAVVLMHTLLELGGGVILLAGALRLVILLLVNRSTETLDFRGPVHAVEITLLRGEVTIRGSASSNPRVRRRLRHGLRRPRVEEHVDDGVLRLTVQSGFVQYE